MEWSKICSQARFNLATSGLTSVPIAEFPLEFGELEITRAGGYGYGPLQQALSQHTGAPPECIVAAAGTSMANHLAMTAVLNPGDEVLLEHPAYGPLLDVATYLGARIRRISRRWESGFALDLAVIDKTLTSQTRLLVLSNLHNPSGALIPEETLRAIGQMAQRVGAYVLIDEVYLEMLFDEHARSSFSIGQTLGAENPFVVTNSLTKAYGLSGLRCGWVLASAELAKRMWLLNDLFEVNAVHVAEHMSVMALISLARFRDRAQALLRANRPLLDAFLDSQDQLECFRPPGGTVVFPRLKDGDPKAFLKLLRDKYETTVVPGMFFEMPQHFRIGIGGDTGELRGGLERLSAALGELASDR